MQVFTLTALPAHPTQMPVLAKNMAVQGEEDRPRHDGLSFYPPQRDREGR